MKVISANREDLPEILRLQYLAYQSEAELCDNDHIPPLTQTLEELDAEFQRSIFLKTLDQNETIIGSIRAYVENGTVFIGKLIVHPDRQRQGIGTQLLREIECVCKNERYELFTSSQSDRNIKLYEKLGYVKFKEQEIEDGLKLVYLSKENK